MLIRALFIIFVFFSLNAKAENIKTFGDYNVHYKVVSSLSVTPEFAARHGLMRGKNIAFVNISIRNQHHKTGDNTAKQAVITGKSSDLIHSAALNFTEIARSDTVYYVAELRFQHKELRTFSIKIQTDPKIAPYTLKFSKTLYSGKHH